MAIEITINYWAVLVVTVINIAVGFLWYSPVLFGKLWMKLSGIDEKKVAEAKKKGMAKNYVIMILSTLVMMYILSYE